MERGAGVSGLLQTSRIPISVVPDRFVAESAREHDIVLDDLVLDERDGMMVLRRDAVTEAVLSGAVALVGRADPVDTDRVHDSAAAAEPVVLGRGRRQRCPVLRAQGTGRRQPMTLFTVEPDRDDVESIRSHLAELVGRPEFAHRALARANLFALGLAVPHGVWFLGLDELVAGATLDDARVVAQRFLVLDGSAPVASAEVPASDRSGILVTEGPFVEATAAAVTSAEARVRVDVEVALLRIPGLYLMALWLRPRDGGPDELVPLTPAPLPLQAGRRYGAAELLAELAPMAAERLAVDHVGG